jgi:hypothetical protein
MISSGLRRKTAARVPARRFHLLLRFIHLFTSSLHSLLFFIVHRWGCGALDI